MWPARGLSVLCYFKKIYKKPPENGQKFLRIFPRAIGGCGFLAVKDAICKADMTHPCRNCTYSSQVPHANLPYSISTVSFRSVSKGFRHPPWFQNCFKKQFWETPIHIQFSVTSFMGFFAPCFVRSQSAGLAIFWAVKSKVRVKRLNWIRLVHSIFLTFSP